MANIVRSAKPGGDWTSMDLRAYHINVVSRSAGTFFGKELPASLDNIDQSFLTADRDTPGLSDYALCLLQYLYLASNANAGQESAIVDWGQELLRFLRFEERGILLRSRYKLPFLICGDANRVAPPDICLVHGTTTILLILQGGGTGLTNKEPEAQVIAEAIAAFQLNNRNRRRLALEEVEVMEFPCITMTGTRPIFYVVPVTLALSQAVEQGQYPRAPTEVRRCVVAGRQLSEGMEKQDFRVEALKHYVLFKELAKSKWEKFYV